MNVGGASAGLVAFDAATGKTVWTATTQQASYSSPEAYEGFRAFKERRSPDWVHPDLRIDGRL